VLIALQIKLSCFDVIKTQDIDRSEVAAGIVQEGIFAAGIRRVEAIVPGPGLAILTVGRLSALKISSTWRRIAQARPLRCISPIRDLDRPEPGVHAAR
jgi:hypothetical protein